MYVQALLKNIFVASIKSCIKDSLFLLHHGNIIEQYSN